MADEMKISLGIDIDPKQGEAELSQLMKELSKSEIKLNVKADDKAIKALQKTLADLGKAVENINKEKIKAQAELDTSKAQKEIAKLQKEIDGINTKKLKTLAIGEDLQNSLKGADKIFATQKEQVNQLVKELQKIDPASKDAGSSIAEISQKFTNIKNNVAEVQKLNDSFRQCEEQFKRVKETMSDSSGYNGNVARGIETRLKNIKDSIEPTQKCRDAIKKLSEDLNSLETNSMNGLKSDDTIKVRTTEINNAIKELKANIKNMKLDNGKLFDKDVISQIDEIINKMKNLDKTSADYKQQLSSLKNEGKNILSSEQERIDILERVKQKYTDLQSAMENTKNKYSTTLDTSKGSDFSNLSKEIDKFGKKLEGSTKVTHEQELALDSLINKAKNLNISVKNENLSNDAYQKRATELQNYVNQVEQAKQKLMADNTGSNGQSLVSQDTITRLDSLIQKLQNVDVAMADYKQSISGIVSEINSTTKAEQDRINNLEKANQMYQTLKGTLDSIKGAYAENKSGNFNTEEFTRLSTSAEEFKAKIESVQSLTQQEMVELGNLNNEVKNFNASLKDVKTDAQVTEDFNKIQQAIQNAESKIGAFKSQFGNLIDPSVNGQLEGIVASLKGMTGAEQNYAQVLTQSKNTISQVITEEQNRIKSIEGMGQKLKNIQATLNNTKLNYEGTKAFDSAKFDTLAQGVQKYIDAVKNGESVTQEMISGVSNLMESVKSFGTSTAQAFTSLNKLRDISETLNNIPIDNEGLRNFDTEKFFQLQEAIQQYTNAIQKGEPVTAKMRDEIEQLKKSVADFKNETSSNMKAQIVSDAEIQRVRDLKQSTLEMIESIQAKMQMKGVNFVGFEMMKQALLQIDPASEGARKSIERIGIEAQKSGSLLQTFGEKGALSFKNIVSAMTGFYGVQSIFMGKQTVYKNL